jgi:hypothetical protein
MYVCIYIYIYIYIYMQLVCVRTGVSELDQIVITKVKFKATR